MSTSVRAQVAAMLAPIIPDTWRVNPHTVRVVPKLPAVTVYIEHTRIEPAPEAPIGTVHNTVTVTVVSRHTDYAKAEDEIDSDVLDLVNEIDAHDRIAWTSAEKVAIPATDPAYLGWALTLTVITQTKE